MIEPVFLTAPQAAELLRVPRTRIKQLEKDGALITVKRAGKTQVPAAFLVQTGETWGLVDSVRGTLTLLRDAGLSSEGMLEWLFSPNDELGATPMELLRAGEVKAVNRAAQTLG